MPLIFAVPFKRHGGIMSKTDNTPKAKVGDRRDGDDRRNGQSPFEGTDRRNGKDRRNGEDRRTSPRVYSR